MSLEIDDDCPACGPAAPADCGDCDDQKPIHRRESIMGRKTAALKAATKRHLPGCDGWHDSDITCIDAMEACDAEDRGAWRPTPASWDCRLAPSRTEPDHRFDFSEYVPDDETECLNGCGMTWDRLRGAE